MRWTLRHGRALWIVALLLALPAVARTVMLYKHLRSDLDELLPRDAPSVIAIEELRRRMTGLQYLGVVVDTGDPSKVAAGERLLDDLQARVRAYPPDLVRAVRVGIAEERAFTRKNAPLFIDLADLKTIRAKIEDRKEYENAKAIGALLDDSDPPPSIDFSDLEAKYKKRDSTSGRFPNDRFTSPELHLTLMLIEVGSFSLGGDTGHRLLDRVRADLVALDPEKYAPGMRIGYTGDVAISVEELSALMSDLTVSSVLVFAAVGLAILVFYRWWRALPALIAPLLLGTFLAFGLVTLPPFSITELNSNTAFLGSIIVGNGINFGIILLARYLEERRRGVGVDEAIVRGVYGARIGTLSAALAAAIAYASLMVTRFRGFRQFGVIGGVGMVLCWVTAFLLMPPLLRWLDNGRVHAAPENPWFMGPVSRFVERCSVAIVVVTLGLAGASIFTLRHVDRNVIEHDLSRLRRRDTETVGEGYWGMKMDAVMHRYLTPVVMLCDDADEATRLAALLRESMKRPPLSELVDSVVSHDDVVPIEQPQKIAETKQIRALLTPRVRSLLEPDKRKQIDDLLGDLSLTEITARDLPAPFKAGLQERDGSIDRAVLVFPKTSNKKKMWEGTTMTSFTATLRELGARAKSSTDAGARVAGSVPLTSDIVAYIEHDGPIATGLALAGVIALVIAMFRLSSSTLLVIASLLTGVLFLFALTMALHVKINFANFITFPITFGIGVDYAVNIVARWEQLRAPGEPFRSAHVLEAIRATGGAVGLCSLTTIIGYSSLLLAENRALFSFGVLAVFGELCCITTAIVALPAFVLLGHRWLDRRRGSQKVRGA